MEYLKGSGDDELTVRVLAEDVDPRRYAGIAASLAASNATPPPTPNPPIALMLAQSALAERDTRWDDREAIVFLRPSPIAGESGVYEFANRLDRTPGLHNYAVSSDYENSYIPNRAWLPRAAPDSSSPEPRYLAAAPDSPTAPTITLSEMKALVAADADMMAKGEDVPGYEDCVRTKFEYDARYEGRPPDMTFHEIRIPSGQPAGYRLSENAPYPRNPAPYYEKWRFAGPNSDLFAFRIVDDPDNDPSTGYSSDEVALRPLPAGEYKVFVNVQYSDWVPCGYNPESLMNRHETTIIAVAPDGVVHEAFFDPADMAGGAAGADDGSGALAPTEFTVGGASASIESIRWESQMAEMRMSPHARLANHRADFIAPDGSVVLRLNFAGAEETGEGDSRAFRWTVSAKPWSGGDTLMLRIGENRPAPSGAPSPTAAP